jgi:D-glutamate cyclase-like protein
VYALLADLVATDTGRGSSRLVETVRSDLEDAARSLARDPGAVRASVLTGFYIPRADPPAAETDGPLGATVLALVIAALGGQATVLTDAPCAPVVEATVAAGRSMAGPLAGSVDVKVWPHVPADGTHTISVERVGRTADGSYRNMRGQDISASTAPLDGYFEASSGVRIAVGDGGNEIGMGRIHADVVESVVEHGAQIRSTVSCDHLVVAGTSNWGAYGLAALLSSLVGPTAGTAQILSEEFSIAVLDAGVAAGAVDGVTALPTSTVDGLSWSDYWSVPAQIGRHLDS